MFCCTVWTSKAQWKCKCHCSTESSKALCVSLGSVVDEEQLVNSNLFVIWGVTFVFVVRLKFSVLKMFALR